MSQQIVDLMETVWQSLSALCDDFTPAQWAASTECPGWSVQDQISHLVGSECRLLGRPAPAHEPADTSHVRNDVGRSNEALVDYRRQFSGAQVLAEFRAVTAERQSVLRAMTAADFAAETDNPLGRGPLYPPFTPIPSSPRSPSLLFLFFFLRELHLRLRS